MKKTQLQRSHDEMASFLYRMLEHSDVVWKRRRQPIVEKHYTEAIRLIRQAGLEYRSPRGVKK